ncbi:MAG TPA: alpha/beta hydrolase [Rubrivivax sp.]
MSLYRRRQRAEPAAETAPAPAPAGLQAPSPWLMLMEARAPWEYAALLAVAPWLSKLPVGDGHPVIVYPGLGASDTSTLAIRNFLHRQGYTPYPWKQGFNLGPRAGVLDKCRSQIERVHQRHAEKASLVGWSLGGVYAREMAKERPQMTRCVITLGAPFAGHPKATNAWRFYKLVTGEEAHDEALLESIRQPPPVPTTSIYSKTDGVVAWQCSINPAGHPHTENIEVHASHIGMGLNPLALYALADRLLQDPAHWKRFDVIGARRWFFKEAHVPEFVTALY